MKGPEGTVDATVVIRVVSVVGAVSANLKKPVALSTDAKTVWKGVAD